MDNTNKHNVIGLCDIGTRTVLRSIEPIKLGDTYNLTNGFYEEPHIATSAIEEVIDKKLYKNVCFIGVNTKHEAHVLYFDKRNDLVNCFFKVINFSEDVSHWEQSVEELLSWTYDKMYEELLCNIDNFEVCNEDDDGSISFEDMVAEYLNAVKLVANLK